ncbi:unnamed protein product [Clonostachys byssicola]|uniref:MULE transposase domain-containing protein n=1 Tax=Clonostachys byssicola TaxID=160290 RepID=A0A9N9U982_9HYPO|nr:unnamed protein product [Clonostachys byssicola]
MLKSIADLITPLNASSRRRAAPENPASSRELPNAASTTTLELFDVAVLIPMGLLAPDTTSTYESPESAWRAADDFAFEQGYALSKPVGYGSRGSKKLFCHRSCHTISPDGLDSIDAPSPAEWYFEDSCPFSMSIVNFALDPEKKPTWRLLSGRQPHTHGPRDLLHLCKIRVSDFEQEHIDLIREQCAQGSSDESILSLVKERFTPCMDRVSIRDIRSITKKFRFESGGLFIFIQELDDYLTETCAVHHTRHDGRNRPDSKFFMLGSEDPSKDAMGRGFFQLLLINVTQHAIQSWKLAEINGYTARGTTFPIAVAVTTSDHASFYQWLIERFSEVRDPERQPTVIISNINPDVADGFKHAFPEAKTQLCMSHFSKDILRVVKELWTGAKGKGALMKQSDLAKEDGTVPRQENQGSGRNDFLMAWKRTVFASSVAEFEDAWENLQTDFASQTSLLEYLKGTYLPFPEQWARAYTNKYRNYAVDNSTPKGGFQSKARSYFQTPAPNLLTLAKEASEQCEYMTHEYAARAVMECNRRKNKAAAVDFFYDIHDVISEKGIDMAYEQYCMARDSLIDPIGEALKPCTKSLITQHGIPCAHTMSSMLQVDRTKSPPVVTARKHILREHVDAFWSGHRAIVRISHCVSILREFLLTTFLLVLYSPHPSEDSQARDRTQHRLKESSIQLMLQKIEQIVDSRTSLRPPLCRGVSRDPLKDLPLNHPTNLNPGRLGIGRDAEPRLVLKEWSSLTLLPRHVMLSGDSHQLSHIQP